MWRKELDPYIKVLECKHPSVLPILFTPPGLQKSVHLTIYLPTSGKEAEFMECLALLNNTIEEVKVNYPAIEILICGDANVNPANVSRSPLFKHFCAQNSLYNVDLHHPTYHHFMGSGCSDSQLDVLLGTSNCPETCSMIFCSF